MAQKSPTTVDQHVGRRIRQRRIILDMSQTALGERLGITFQQIQKYEKGGNRISASRLLGVAEALEVPVSYFFEGIGGAAKEGDDGRQQLLIDKDGADLLRAFNKVEDQQMRHAIIAIAKAAGQSPIKAS